jgi:hypothetical protein
MKSKNIYNLFAFLSRTVFFQNYFAFSELYTFFFAFSLSAGFVFFLVLSDFVPLAIQPQMHTQITHTFIPGAKYMRCFTNKCIFLGYYTYMHTYTHTFSSTMMYPHGILYIHTCIHTHIHFPPCILSQVLLNNKHI